MNLSTVAKIPPPPEVPIPVLFLIIFALVSMILYTDLIWIIVRNRGHHSYLRSPFFQLIVYNYIGDAIMFVYIEIIMRPRKYRYFNLFDENTPTWFAYVSFYGLMTFGTFMDLSFVPLALNRLTAAGFPLIHQKLWSNGKAELLVILNWILSFLSSAVVFLVAPSYCYFLILPSGILQLAGNSSFVFSAAFSAFATTLCMGICLVCYLYALFDSRKSEICTKQNSQLEKKLLMCSLLSTLPLVGEFIRSLWALIGNLQNNLQTIVITTEIWFYWTELMVAAPCWSLLITTSDVRSMMLENGILTQFFARRKTTVKHSIGPFDSNSAPARIEN